MKTKKVLIGLLAGFVAVVAIFIVIVALQPSEFRVSRSAVIPVPPEVVFGEVNQLRKWGEWSPWAKLDPNAKYRFEGPEAGKGAAMNWEGNSAVGEGKMTILESRPHELIRFQLEFFKPMAGVSESEFLLKPQGNGTELTWTMSGKNNFVGKAICLFGDIDKMMGSQFEQGLSNLKRVLEAAHR